MAVSFLNRLAINDDVDAEFAYWKSQLVLTAWMGVGFALAAAFAIAAWPAGTGDPEVRAFARGIWPLIVECAFWCGFLAGLLWGAAKRMGAALSGILPWLPENTLGHGERRARFLGQWAACFALAGLALWLSDACASIATVELAWLRRALQPLMQASAMLAAACAVLALAHRRQT